MSECVPGEHVPGVSAPALLHGSLALGLVHALELEVAAVCCGAEAFALEEDEGYCADDLCPAC